jgi:hypothetical protein
MDTYRFPAFSRCATSLARNFAMVQSNSPAGTGSLLSIAGKYNKSVALGHCALADAKKTRRYSKIGS